MPSNSEIRYGDWVAPTRMISPSRSGKYEAYIIMPQGMTILEETAAERSAATPPTTFTAIERCSIDTCHKTGVTYCGGRRDALWLRIDTTVLDTSNPDKYVTDLLHKIMRLLNETIVVPEPRKPMEAEESFHDQGMFVVPIGGRH